MAKKPRRSRYASEAAAESLVRFGPQLEALQELQQQAVENRAQSIAQAKGGAAGTIAEIDRTLPQMRALYDQAGRDAAQRAAILGPDLAGLGPVANSIRRAAQIEQGQGARMLGQSAVNSIGGLLERRVGTKEGEKFQTQNAQSQFVSDLAKLMTRRQGLAGQAGAFQATTISELTREDRKARRDAREAAAKLDLDTAKFGETARHNRAMENKPSGRGGGSRSGGSRPPGATDARTSLQHGSAKDRIGSIRAEVAPFAKRGQPRHKIAALFREGAPKTDTAPAIKPIPEAWLSIALDLEYDGKLSRRNVAELHRRGYSLRQLGLPTNRRGTVPGVRLPNPWTARARG